jgi:hypothetical protein
MSKQEQLRPWAEWERPAGMGPGPDDEMAALFRRVDVAVHFKPERVALAVLNRRSAPHRLRFAMAMASVLLLGSVGALAAVSQMPSLALWLMTISSKERPAPSVLTRAPEPAAALAPVAAPPEAPSAPEPVAPEPQVTPSAPEPAPVALRSSEPNSAGLSAGSSGRTHRKSVRRLAMNRRSAATSDPLSSEPAPDKVSDLASDEVSVETLATEAVAAEAVAPGTVAPVLPAELPPPSGPAPRVGDTSALPVVPESESQLARETRLLQRAYANLRGDDDPAGALDTLDEYLSAHPLGLLRKEASSARIEALLKLSRRAEALRALRGYPFGEGARDAELRVVRGELIAAEDCRAAIRDFVAVSDKVVPEVAERALYGQAACQAQLGERADAAASFRAYLQRFPQGRFAAEARRQIEDRSK